MQSFFSCRLWFKEGTGPHLWTPPACYMVKAATAGLHHSRSKSGTSTNRYVAFDEQRIRFLAYTLDLRHDARLDEVIRWPVSHWCCCWPSGIIRVSFQVCVRNLLTDQWYRSSGFEPDIPIRALRSLHRFLTRGNVSAQRAIYRYMDLSDNEHCTNVMTQILVHLSTVMYVWYTVLASRRLIYFRDLFKFARYSGSQDIFPAVGRRWFQIHRRLALYPLFLQYRKERNPLPARHAWCQYIRAVALFSRDRRCPRDCTPSSRLWDDLRPTWARISHLGSRPWPPKLSANLTRKITGLCCVSAQRHMSGIWCILTSWWPASISWNSEFPMGRDT